MPKTLKERIAKLPKWAQQYINKLERDVVSLRKEHDAIEAGETCISWYDVLDRRPKPESNHYLPDGIVVSFEINCERIDCRIMKDRTLGKNILHISSFTDRLVIRPQVTNVVWINVQGDDNGK